jgi:hypothetical protein
MLISSRAPAVPHGLQQLPLLLVCFLEKVTLSPNAIGGVSRITKRQPPMPSLAMHSFSVFKTKCVSSKTRTTKRDIETRNIKDLRKEF